MRKVLMVGVLTLFTSSLFSQATPGNAGVPPPFKVVLDAGHGGHDPGNLGNGYLEKDIALQIVLAVGSYLEKESGVEVIYTRKDDSFVDLFVRGEIANKAKADLFVSVHCDSHTSNAYGAGTFVLGLHANKQNFEIAKKENSVIYLEDNYETRYAEYDINSPESVIGLTIMQEEFLDQSILLGKLMQDRFTGDLKRNDRKVKQAGFIVLHQTFMPSVLVETGFLTNKDEGRFLNSRSGQQQMGQAIAAAILEYRESIATQTPSGMIALVDESPGTTDETKVDNAQGTAEMALEEPAGVDTGTATGKTPENPVVDGSGTPPASSGSTKDAIEESTKAAVSAVVDSAPPADMDSGLPAVEQPIPPASEQPKPPASVPGITFRVQLIAVSKEPVLHPDRYNGLKNLSAEQHNNVYRVLYGNTESYEEAERLQAFAARRGYPSAYIVAYRDGKRIPLPEALATRADQE